MDFYISGIYYIIVTSVPHEVGTLSTNILMASIVCAVRTYGTLYFASACGIEEG